MKRYDPTTLFRPLLATMLLLLAGCTLLGPDYVKTDPALPGAWSQPASSETVQDLGQWWQVLGDPVLVSLIERSLQQSPDIAVAQARLREARARRDLASGNRFPTVTASGSSQRSRSAPAGGEYATTHLFQAGFDASWEPDVFGAQRRALEASVADFAASQASLHGTQVSLAAEAALNYVELRSAQARLKIARDNLAAQSETLQIANWRAQAGLSTALDVDQARTNRDQTQAAIPALETVLTQAENRLSVLTGEAPGSLHAELQAPVALPVLSDQVAAGIPADVLRQRPDVVAAERKLAAETARIGEAVAAKYPGFSLGGTFGWKALALNALGGAGSVTQSLLASVTQMLYDGGRIESRIAIQNAVQQQALANYEKTVLTALEDVENALAAYANNRQRQQALRSAAGSARSAASLARQLYESGNADFQKVLDAERSRLSVEDSLASAEAEGVTALIQLYKALGGGWSETEESNESPT